MLHYHLFFLSPFLIGLGKQKKLILYSYKFGRTKFSSSKKWRNWPLFQHCLQFYGNSFTIVLLQDCKTPCCLTSHSAALGQDDVIGQSDLARWPYLYYLCCDFRIRCSHHHTIYSTTNPASRNRFHRNLERKRKSREAPSYILLIFPLEILKGQWLHYNRAFSFARFAHFNLGETPVKLDKT